MPYYRNYQDGGFVSQRDAYLEIDRIAKENDFNPLDLHTMAMMESSYGSGKGLDEGTYQGFFQFGEGAAKEYNVKDRLNVGQSAKGAIDLVRGRTKGFEDRAKEIEEQNISDPGLLGYLTHQQGREGFLDILTTAKSGTFGKGGTPKEAETRRNKIWKNLSEAEKELVLGEDADKYREGETYSLPSIRDVPNATLAKDYLGYTKQRWNAKKEEMEGLIGGFDPSYVAPGMADGGDVRGQSTDTVPAMLTPGEFVIRKDAADKIGPEKLQMLNNIDRLSDTALLENAKSPMGYQKGGKVKQEADCEGGECAVPTIASQTGLFSMPWKGKDVQIDLMSAMGDRAAPQYMASDAAGEYFMMDAGDIPADSLKAWWNQMVGSTTSSIFEKQEGGYINGYQKGGLVGMLGDFIGGQKENWARAKTMGEETGVRNPFLRTKDEQLAQMQGAGTMPRGGWLEKKMPQAYGEGDNPEVSGPSQQKMVEQESEILSNATINGQSATQSQIDAAMEKARQGLAAKKEPHVSALTGGIASTGEAYAKTTKEIGEREALYSAIPELGEVGTYGLGYRGTPEDLKKTTVEDYLFAMFNEPTKGSAGQGYRAVEDAVNALMGPESARLKEEAREAGDPSTKAEFYRDIVRGKGHGDAQREAFEELTKGYGSWTVPGVSVEPEGGWAEDVLTGKKHKELWEKASPREQAKRREVEAFAVPARHYAVRELLSKLKGAGADSGWGEYIQGRYGKSNGGYIHGYQEGGEVMNYQDGGQLKDVLSIFGEKSKQGDEMQKLMAMAAMQQMQRAQQVQQAIGMQGGGYADEYQQGGAVEPPMSGPESGPQEAPLPGGDQTYHQPAMEQLDMDQYEYASYVDHGPDMYKWMAPKYKSKQQWTPYDAMVDAGTIDPYEIGKDEISVVTNDQLEALSNQAKESMRV